MKLFNDIHARLPGPLYTAEQTRQLDQSAIEQGIPGIVLMKRAGREVFDTLLQDFAPVEKLTVFCGGGNNGGDGYIVAALAADRAIPVTVVTLKHPDSLTGDAARARDLAKRSGVPLVAFGDHDAIETGVVVDALLGTGAKGKVREDYRRAIGQLNDSPVPVIAVDIPSGLDADTGAQLGACVEADCTVTVIGLKQGLLTADGPAHIGTLIFADLGLPRSVYESVTSAAERLDYRHCLAYLPPRRANTHKGKFGHVLVIGGDQGMGGAAAMAAEAAARAGAGLVSVATRPEHIPAILARRPELMVKGVASDADIQPLLERATVIVLGPGLGRSEWSAQLFRLALAAGLPLVIDADALTLLGGKLQDRALPAPSSDQWIITPHPGEAAALLQTTPQTVMADRFAAARQLRQLTGAVTVLKGSGTLIAADPAAPLSLVAAGNPGMASGGMGDLLSGVLGGLLAQGLTATRAAQLGALVHSMAADRAVAVPGQRGLLATDLFPHLRALLNERELNGRDTDSE